jgi:hypothetical protein
MAESPEVQSARRAAQIRAIERKDRLAAWNDYLGFTVTKIAGFSCLVVGTLELIQPSLLAIGLTKPGAVAGAGLALLVGPKTVNVLAKVLNAIKP